MALMTWCMFLHQRRTRYKFNMYVMCSVTVIRINDHSRGKNQNQRNRRGSWSHN